MRERRLNTREVWQPRPMLRETVRDKRTLSTNRAGEQPLDNIKERTKCLFPPFLSSGPAGMGKKGQWEEKPFPGEEKPRVLSADNSTESTYCFQEQKIKQQWCHHLPVWSNVLRAHTAKPDTIQQAEKQREKGRQHRNLSEPLTTALCFSPESPLLFQWHQTHQEGQQDIGN